MQLNATKFSQIFTTEKARCYQVRLFSQSALLQSAPEISVIEPQWSAVMRSLYGKNPPFYAKVVIPK